MIPLLEFPLRCPWCFAAVAVAWSVVQGLAGYQYGLYIFDAAALKFESKEPDKHLRPAPGPLCQYE